MRVRNEFLDFDILMSALQDNYLLKAQDMILEAVTSNPNADSSWYIKWKSDTALTMKNTFNKFKGYANRQIAKYAEWLNDNAKYFDTQKYPPPSGSSISNAPDYKSAINRIKRPMSQSISSVDLEKIQAGINHDQDAGSLDNRWFMKLLIPEYNGTGDAFLRYCKMYYNGEGKKRNLTPEDMVEYVPIMYNYCLNFGSLVHSLEGELNTIIMYINTDPISKFVEPTDNAERQYQTLQQNQAIKGANTNPNNNVVQHASYDYHSFRELYMINEAISYPIAKTTGGGVRKAGPFLKPSISPNVNMNRQNTVNNMHPGNNAPPRPNNNAGQLQKPNHKQMLMKKKQVACNIVKDCFHAKVNAAGLIYRDFIITLQTVAHLTQEQIQKNKLKNSKKKKDTKAA